MKKRENLKNKIKSIEQYLCDSKEAREQYFSEGTEEIETSNLKMLIEVSFYTTLLTLVFMLITPFVILGWEPTVPHLLLPPVAGIFFLLAVFCKEHRQNMKWMTDLLCLGFIACVLVIVIGIDAFQYPDQPSSFMQPLLIVLPCLFVFRFRLIYLEMFLFEIIYVILIFQNKELVTAQNDCFNSIVGIIISCFVSSIMQRLRAETYNSKNQYRSLSRIDGLTGVLNKISSEEAIKEYLQQRQTSIPCALLVFDVDDFKQVNDSQGHKKGDDVLEAMVDALMLTFRDTDIVGRFGGDEFIVFMKNTPNTEVIRKRCSQLFEYLEGISKVFGFSITCSVGVSFADEEEICYEQLFQQADYALYGAKAFGKAQVEIHRFQTNRQFEFENPSYSDR